MTLRRNARRALLASLGAGGLLIGCGGGSSDPVSVNSLEAISTRADMVSGGDVLLKLRVASQLDPATMVVELNGTDVTGVFRSVGSQELNGLVTGLRDGTNQLATWQRGTDGRAVAGTRAELRVTNHPIAGPVFSGPQETPFYCQTHQFRLYENGPFYTNAAIDLPCMAPTRVDHVYRTTAGAFAAYDPQAAAPNDMAVTVTNEGRTVPYIVRIETGTVNRAIYQFALLADPASTGVDYPAWNRRLVYAFGGGCSGGHYIQGSTTGDVFIDDALSRGFAVASASLNVYRNNCNDVTSAETAMMVKEKFIETYGPVRYTIGWGSSAGGIQQITTAGNYPGILNGIIPRQSFPDLVQATVVNSRLLLEYYNNHGAGLWTQEQMRLASGFGTFGQLNSNGGSNAVRYEAVPTRPGWQNAAWNAIVPNNVRYDPVTNPTGARPTFFDHNVNTYGKDANGFARRALDNVGVQYGLVALNAGDITKDQFLDLNEKIGGVDIDFNFTPGRTVADPIALRAAYQTGKVTNGGGGLAMIPVLDVDGSYADYAVNGNVHLKFQHFSVRERVRNANGNADNYVMWSGAHGTSASAVGLALVAMDAWLANIVNDAAPGSVRDKVIRNKPSSLKDGCYKDGAFIEEVQFKGLAGSSPCNTLYPTASFPLEAAGGPLANDIVKCQLKPINLTEYNVSFTAQEAARLQSIFPGGVCDWSKPGVEQGGLLSTWLRYTGIGSYQPAD
ncbi:DUF6351 family protein [Comamonadaceae bacterium G21597-S1]|nr:DUF6351 family protein [Comamonadaceae bacterium G21597-S1]